MKLDMDCVRDILLACESSDPMRTPTMTEDIAAIYGEKWDSRDIKYTVSKMSEGGLITATILNDGCPIDQQEVAIFSITWNGHQFLEQVRDDKRWSGVKTALSAIRNYSLSAISSVAEGMTSAAINAYFSTQK